MEGPEVAARRAGDGARAREHRPIIVGRRRAFHDFARLVLQEFAAGCRYHRMRRGLLLLVTARGGGSRAGRVPPPPRPPPPRSARRPSRADHDDQAAGRPPRPSRPRRRRRTTTRPTTTTTTSAGGGDLGARTARSGACTVFPADNAWNRDVSTLPVDANSAQLPRRHRRPRRQPEAPRRLRWRPASTASRTSPCPASQPTVPRRLRRLRRRERPGPVPDPAGRAGRGRERPHVLAVDRDHCKLYELFAASAGHRALVGELGRGVRPHVERAAPGAGGRRPTPPGCRSSPGSCATTRWRAVTSTTRCASRCRARRRAYLHPATHYASSCTDPNLPPMGLRLRLKASFDVSGTPASRASC